MAIDIGLLVLMASGPFLLPIHTAPIPSFWGECLAGILGLAAAMAGLLTVRRDSAAMPPVLGVPFLLLLVLAIQFATLKLSTPQVGLLYAGYLIWAGLLMLLGKQLADRIGHEQLADVLASAIVLGAGVSAAIALAQWLMLTERIAWIFSGIPGTASGNMGQANHLTHYIWLGLASALYLRQRERVGSTVFWLLANLLALGSVLGGSRSVFAYSLVLLCIAGWARVRRRAEVPAGVFRNAMLLMALVLLLNGLVAWGTPHLPALRQWFIATFLRDDLLAAASAPNAAVAAGARLFALASGPSIRLAIARTAWDAFLENPWLGYGAGGYAWASFVAAAAGREGMQVMEHAHNVVLQGLVEFGAPASVAVLLLLVFWMRRFMRQPWGLPQYWCAGMLGIGAVHSMLEYPLWYAYFLGPTALLLGAFDTGKAFSIAGQRLSVYLILVALIGAVILANLRRDYTTIEAASYHPLSAHQDRETAWRISMDRLLAVYRDSLLSPWALMAFVNLAEPSRTLAADRAALCEKGIRFAPARSLVARCAMHLAIAGRTTDAMQLGDAVLHAFPAERTETIAEWRREAQHFPELTVLLSNPLILSSP